MRRLALVLFLVACTKGPAEIGPDLADGGSSFSDASTPGEDTHVSGTRLKRRIWKGADGSQQFAGWFDSERKVECSFQFAGDGKLRCLPPSVPAFAYYEDSACTKPLAVAPKGCTPPTTAIQSATSNSCTRPISRVLPVVAPFLAATLYTKGTSCSSIASASIVATNDLYTTGAELSSALFVEASEEVL